MTGRITWKFFAAFTFLVFVTVFVLNFFVSFSLRDDFERKITEKLQSNALLAAKLLEGKLIGGEREVIQKKTKNLAAKLGVRITVIDERGVVLGDSEKEPTSMENHSDRPEVVEAVKKGTGQSTRFSNTLGYTMKYVTVRVDNDKVLGVVRFALPLSEVQLEINVIYRAVLLGAVAAIAIALIVAYFVSRSISGPIRQMQKTAECIAKGDFGRAIQIKRKDELGELAESLNTMAGELRLKIENLKKMDRMRTDFVANVSHELRTPLTSIKGFVETLEDGAINDRETTLRFISIIKKHTDRLENIISDLLSLSELESQTGAIEKVEFDLKNLIEEISLGFGHALAVKQQKLKINPQGEDFRIKADRDRIEQIFVNLMDNAIKYTEEAGEITVSLFEQEGQITVVVEDNGIGIPREHLDRVFERFYRVDKARSRKLGGTGLGLGIAKHIVLAHNGQIRIESEIGRGTKVFVTLPRA